MQNPLLQYLEAIPKSLYLLWNLVKWILTDLDTATSTHTCGSFSSFFFLVCMPWRNFYLVQFLPFIFLLVHVLVQKYKHKKEVLFIRTLLWDEKVALWSINQGCLSADIQYGLLHGFNKTHPLLFITTVSFDPFSINRNNKSKEGNLFASEAKATRIGILRTVYTLHIMFFFSAWRCDSQTVEN